jgi:glycosyltransferase involved in cell wall biosynthesis
MTPLVSIVIPTYNRASDLKRALKSVREQTLTDWEAIIVDNHSTDDTDEVVESFNDPRIKFLKIHNHGVIAASRNKGVAESNGDYIAFLDSDDWWTAEKLERSVRYLKNGCDVVYHRLYVVTSNDQIKFSHTTPSRNFTKPVYLDLLINGNAIANSSIVVKADLFKKIGGISEDLDMVAGEDYEGWLRLAKITDRYFLMPEVLGYYWAGGGNMTNFDRTLSFVKKFHEKYKEEVIKYGVNGSVNWTAYAQGRIHYLQKDFTKAKLELEKIRLNIKHPSVYLKKIYMLAIIGFKN